MRIDKMRAWVGRPATGAERLQLGWDGPALLEPLADWTFDEMRTMAEAGEDLADTIQSIAQEHCDAQADASRCTYKLRWIGSNDRVLRVAQHHVRPTPREEDDPLGAALAEQTPTETRGGGSQGLFYEAMVKELARALLDKDRAMNEAYKTSLAANQKTIEMLVAQAEASFKLVGELRAEVTDLQEHKPQVVTEAEQLEAMRRAQAWDKVLAILPEATQLGMHVLATKLGAADESPAAPNGHAGAEA